MAVPGSRQRAGPHRLAPHTPAPPRTLATASPSRPSHVQAEIIKILLTGIPDPAPTRQRSHDLDVVVDAEEVADDDGGDAAVVQRDEDVHGEGRGGGADRDGRRAVRRVGRSSVHHQRVRLHGSRRVVQRVRVLRRLALQLALVRQSPRAAVAEESVHVREIYFSDNSNTC